jgi:hypothetical protein
MLSKRAYKIIAIVAFAGLGLNSVATGVLYKNQAQEAIARDEVIRETAIKNCRTIGEPLLQAQIHSAKTEIARTRAALQRAKGFDLDLLAERLGVSKATLEAGQQDQRNTITTDQAILQPLLAAPTCAERYPPLT